MTCDCENHIVEYSSNKIFKLEICAYAQVGLIGFTPRVYSDPKATRVISNNQSYAKYVLTDTSTNSILWTYEAIVDTVSNGESLEVCPRGAAVSDDGWTVIRAFYETGSSFFGFSPQGKITFRHCLTEKLRGQTSYCGRVSKWGAILLAGSLIYFLSNGKTKAVCVSTWWRTFCAIELETGRFIEDIPKEAIAEHENKIIIARLSTDIKSQPGVYARLEDYDPFQSEYISANPLSSDIIRNFMHAAYHAGCNHVEAAIPALFELEKLVIVCGSSFESPFRLLNMMLRKVAKLSLLRLGEVPKGYPSFIFCRDDTKEVFQFPTRPTTLDGFEPKIDVTPLEILSVLGSPDIITNDANPPVTDEKIVNSPNDGRHYLHNWLYDFGYEDGFTLLLRWNGFLGFDDFTLHSVKRVTPPLWRNFGLYDKEVNF